MNNIDIFASAKPQSGEFFKFKSVGDSIQGTYIDVRNGTDSFGNQQTIYVLQDSSDGKIWNLGFRSSQMVIHERMNSITFGQIVGFKFDEERESKRNPGTKVKIIRIYADPKFVDQAWLDHQKSVGAHFTPQAQASDDNGDFAPGNPLESKTGLDYGYDEQDAPDTASPATGSMAAKTSSDVSEVIVAIRQLSLTKGLTNSSMTKEIADKAIEDFSGLELNEENSTKIIIALTGYKVS